MDIKATRLIELYQNHHKKFSLLLILSITLIGFLIFAISYLISFYNADSFKKLQNDRNQIINESYVLFKNKMNSDLNETLLYAEVFEINTIDSTLKDTLIDNKKYFHDDYIDHSKDQIIKLISRQIIHNTKIKDESEYQFLGIERDSLKRQVLKLVSKKSTDKKSIYIPLEEVNHLFLNKNYNLELLEKQKDLNQYNVDFAINKSKKYLALYNGLLAVIIFFTMLMSIGIFMISNKGWGGSNYAIKIFAINVVIILGISNLVKAVVKPKDNFEKYFASANKSEHNQFKIFKVMNEYDQISPKKMDSIILQNYYEINSIAEILPQIDDKNISVNSFDLGNVSTR